MEPGEGRPGQGITVAAAGGGGGGRGGGAAGPGGGKRDVLEGSGAKGQGEWNKAAFLG